MSFWDNRISLTADYYYKKTKDLLLNATLAPSMGFLSAYRNVGSVSNSGLELTIDTKIYKRKSSHGLPASIYHSIATKSCH